MSRSVSGSPEYRRTLWWQNADRLAPTERLTADKTADVAVIGGGFTGLTAAWHLARRGLRVTLLEAGMIGGGASGFNAGFVVPNFAKADPPTVIAQLGEERGRRLLAMIGQGADRVFETARTHGIACDAEQVGWLHVAHSQTMLDVLRERAEAWRKLGRPIRMLEAAEARQLTAARHCVGALLDPSGGMLHPLNYAFGLARLAAAAGVALYEQARVDAVARSGSRWRVSTAKGSIHADQVLLCTNAAMGGVARRLARMVVPLRVYQIATKPLPSAEVERIAPARNPVADTRANLFTYRLDRDDRLISGGMAIVPIAAHGRMARMIAGRLAAELGLKSVPEVEFVWRGTAAMTTDFLPHVYEFAPGFIGGIGCNGRGIALTAMLGEVLADAATGTPLADLPIPPASPRAIPFHAFAQAAPSFAIAQAKWHDRHLAK
ncbi:MULTISPECIES: FAD-binding oxidoreductase [unclassified Chelatococcus]|uniref:NAD(P)/FAD-dependent oxidoreductase n=1 Tax=unclassified Chelatococcus TaxID=2638111 RepID=UPI001BCA8237|nr:MULTISPECIES: FAD-binding oxidoreductase [unclassified Chelatococcus]MBS7700921.1 FAD-binding oxidoreductase [Chelatococcus sp. YT9]MBX3555454.1 FAD-binding oxidoreductase [Chelatococcus sp.]